MTAPAPRLRRATRALIVGLAGAVALAVSACGADASAWEGEPERLPLVAPSTTTTTTTGAPAPGPEAAPTAAQRAEAHGSSISVYDTADATEPVREIVSGIDTSVDTIPVVFLVKSVAASRLEVYLPVRPNGSVGWVDAADVTVTSLPYRIEVVVPDHRLRVFDGDEMIVDEPVGVGQADLPTPGGIYYLKELLQPPDPNGIYGPYAYGLSGFSNVLQSFNGGPGVIGIHGTNDPSSIGTDVSHGCIRLDNAVIERLVHEIGLPLGTPVEIIG